MLFFFSFYVIFAEFHALLRAATSNVLSLNYLLIIADSKVSSVRRSLGIAIKSDGMDNDDVNDHESNETRIVLAL